MDPTRIAVVTGASSGIGRATARLFLHGGLRVVANGRHAERLAELNEIVGPDDGRLIKLLGDIRQPDLIFHAFEAARTRWSQTPDLLVLCAGRGLPGTLLGSDSSQWHDLLEHNYLSMMHQLRDAAQQLVADAMQDPTRPRDIVVIGSTVGRVISTANPVYGSTKFAVHSLAESLRQEVCNYNIRVTLIEPGFVKSEFQRNAGYDLGWFATIEQQHGPLLAPEDIARTIEFVTSQPSHVHIDDIRIRPTKQPT
jgi:NADP-dependent 3-hydroxy acid dehydrogenase YdfG